MKWIPLFAAEGLEQQLGELGSLPLWVLIGYLMLLLFLGWLGWKKSTSGEEDYYLAGRKQGWIISSVTIMATFFSSAALMGSPGAVYREGVAFALFSLNVPVAGVCIYLLGTRIWKIGRAKGYVTPGDMLSDYYNSRFALRFLVALTSLLYVIPYVVIQIKAGGLLSEQLIHHEDSFVWGASLLASVTMLYIMIGGMRSVAYTDLIQGVMLILGMLVSGFAMLLIFGDPFSFGDQIMEQLPNEALTVPGTTSAYPWTKLLSICLVVVLGTMVQPAQWMRFYAADSVKTLKRATVIFTVVLTSCFLFGVMLIGLAGRLLYPPTSYLEVPLPDQVFLNIPVELEDRIEPRSGSLRWIWQEKQRPVFSDEDLNSILAVNPEIEAQVAIRELQQQTEDTTLRAKVEVHPDVGNWNSILIVVISKHLPRQLPWGHLGLIVASLIVVAIMAASMSTADSSLHALSAVVTRDIYTQMFRPKSEEKERVIIGRVVIVVATILALWIAIKIRNPNLQNKFVIFKMIMDMSFLAIAFSCQLIPILFDVIFIRKGTRLGAIAGLTSGLIVTFLFGQLFPLMLGSIPGPTILHNIKSGIDSLTSEIKVDPSVWGILVNITLFVLLSACTRKPDPQMVTEYEQILSS